MHILQWRPEADGKTQRANTWVAFARGSSKQFDLEPQWKQPSPFQRCVQGRDQDSGVCSHVTPAASARTCLLGGCERKLSRWGRIHGNSQLPDTGKKENNRGAARLTQSELSFFDIYVMTPPPCSARVWITQRQISGTERQKTVYFQRPVRFPGSLFVSELVAQRLQEPNSIFFLYFSYFIYSCQRRG